MHILAPIPLRECGMGTFTNLVGAMVGDNGKETAVSEGFVIGLSDHDQFYAYPEEVKSVIRQTHQADYLKAADFINLSGAGPILGKTHPNVLLHSSEEYRIYLQLLGTSAGRDSTSMAG